VVYDFLPFPRAGYLSRLDAHNASPSPNRKCSQVQLFPRIGDVGGPSAGPSARRPEWEFLGEQLPSIIGSVYMSVDYYDQLNRDYKARAYSLKELCINDLNSTYTEMNMG
jgi:hypothetical protein